MCRIAVLPHGGALADSNTVRRFSAPTQSANPPASPGARRRSDAWFEYRAQHGWLHPAVDSRSQKPKGTLTLGTRMRRLLWSWWPWAIVSVWAISELRWQLAIGAGAMALVSYLIAPATVAPRYGLEHTFAVDSPEFARTIAGASGTPFVAGNSVTLLNNGDAFYPAMLAAIEARRDLSDGGSVHLLGRRNRTDLCGRACGTSEGRDPGEDSAGRGRVGEYRRRHPSHAGVGRVSSGLVQPDSLVHARPVQQSHASEIPDCRRPDRVYRGSRHCRSVAGKREGSGRVARHADSSRGPWPSSPCKPGLRTTGRRLRESS